MYKFKVYFWNNLPNQLFKELKEEYKDRQKDYMTVYIFKNLNEMYKKVRGLNAIKEDELDDYAGRTFCFDSDCYTMVEDKETKIKVFPHCGYIFLSDEKGKSNLTFNQVCHETTHAVFGYFARKLKKYNKILDELDEEGHILYDSVIEQELFCYMCGNIADKIVQMYDKYEDKKENVE